jgi:hypothetical protein
MKVHELIKILEKYPTDYDILMGFQGYDGVSVASDNDYEIVYLDGYFKT